MQETRLSKFAVIKRLSLLCIFGHQLRLALSRGILVFRGPLIRPFDIYKHCIKLKVNKPCHWLAGFVYLLLINNGVCLVQGFIMSKGLIVSTIRYSVSFSEKYN